MVSRRNYFAIATMMLVVFFLFQLPQYFKDAANPYTVNTSVADGQPLTRQAMWEPAPLESLKDAAKLNRAENYLLYVGSMENGTGYAVRNWAQITHASLLQMDEVPAWQPGKMPNAILIEGTSCHFPDDLQRLKQWNLRNVPVIFCSMPDGKELAQCPEALDFLGIQELRAEETDITSIHLFSGFLLGGEQIYDLNRTDNNREMDLDYSVAWPILGRSTTTYMMGLVPEELLADQMEHKNQYEPALIWRHRLNNSYVFAVNGDFLTGNMGIGILSAFMAECDNYYLYPVVNAQVLTVANFPSLADENYETIHARYGYSLKALNRDLLWPGLESTTSHSNGTLSCFLMPQYDYQDGIAPELDQISFYLKLLQEKEGEAGLSLQHSDDISLAQKWEEDAPTRQAEAYPYRAAYTSDLAELAENRAIMEQFDTVTGPLEQDLFCFASDRMLCQTTTHDALSYTDASDMELRSLQTALGYSNVLIDLLQVSWPEETTSGWESLYDTMTSNLLTYWNRYRKFDSATISQSDRKVRNLLSLEYAEQRQDDTIQLTLPEGREADFILRTHRESITDVTGGTFEKLEQGAWLIHASDMSVEIKLELDSQYYY